jgi:hypothetical protein
MIETPFFRRITSPDNKVLFIGRVLVENDSVA